MHLLNELIVILYKADSNVIFMRPLHRKKVQGFLYYTEIWKSEKNE